MAAVSEAPSTSQPREYSTVLVVQDTGAVQCLNYDVKVDQVEMRDVPPTLDPVVDDAVELAKMYAQTYDDVLSKITDHLEKYLMADHLATFEEAGLLKWQWQRIERLVNKTSQFYNSILESQQSRDKVAAILEQYCVKIQSIKSGCLKISLEVGEDTTLLIYNLPNIAAQIRAVIIDSDAVDDLTRDRSVEGKIVFEVIVKCIRLHISTREEDIKAVLNGSANELELTMMLQLNRRPFHEDEKVDFENLLIKYGMETEKTSGDLQSSSSSDPSGFKRRMDDGLSETAIVVESEDSDQSLFDAYKKFGVILSITGKPDSRAGVVGKRLIRFENASSAAATLAELEEKMPGKAWKSLKLNVPILVESAIVMRTLTPDVKEKDLRSQCEKYGAIKSTNLLTFENEKGGYVRFEFATDARKALYDLQSQGKFVTMVTA